MKNIILLSLVLLGTLFSSCHDEELSYLDITTLNYPINSLTVVIGLTEDDTLQPFTPPVFPWDPQTPSPSVYRARILNKSPWVAAGFYGASVEGARPLTVTLENVKTEGDLANAETLRKEIQIVGEGRILIPYDTKLTVGKYILSLRISNIHGFLIVEDIFTINVTDQKW